MTRIEKIISWWIAGIFMFLFVVGWNIGTAVREAGGITNVVVDAGKWIKDVAAEIEEHEPKKEGE